MTREEAVTIIKEMIGDMNEEAYYLMLEARDEPSEYEYYMEKSSRIDRQMEALQMLLQSK